MGDYYDRAGRPTGMLEWAADYGSNTERTIADDLVPLTDGTHARVCTAWIGINRNPGQGPPLIFETHVAGMHGEDGGFYRQQYATEALARDGHAQAVNWIHQQHPARR